MKAKDRSKNNSLTQESKRRKELSQSFERFGVSCGYCAPTIIDRVCLLDGFSRSDILKNIQPHNCDCISIERIISAISAVYEKTALGDGWEPILNQQAIIGQRLKVSDIQISGMVFIAPIFADEYHGLFHEIVLPKGVTAFSALTHPNNPLFSQFPSTLKADSLIGLLVADSMDSLIEVRESVEINVSEIGIEQSYKSTIGPNDVFYSEPDCCIVNGSHIFVNGICSDSWGEHFPEYTIHNWDVGGGFGFKTRNSHIHWATWCALELQRPVYLVLTPEDSYRLRPKTPPLTIQINQVHNQMVLSLSTVPEMDEWLQDTVDFLKQSFQALEDYSQLRFVTELRPHHPFQYTPSFQTTYQASGWFWEQWWQIQETDEVTTRILWAQKVGTLLSQPTWWIETIAHHAERCLVDSTLNVGWGMGFIPSKDSLLPSPLMGIASIVGPDEIHIVFPIPESEGYLASQVVQTLHYTTGLPIDVFHYYCNGDHPAPGWDWTHLRPHILEVCTELGLQIHQSLMTVPFEDLIGASFNASNQTCRQTASACSVISVLDDNGHLIESWVSMDAGQSLSLSQVTATISGRWHRNLERSNDQLFNVHWDIQRCTKQIVNLGVVDIATIASIKHARRRLGLSYQHIPFINVH